MSIAPRPDDFATRRAPLQPMTDDALQAYFWRLADDIVQLLVEAARTHTSPSIERSVLLRMGFSSLEARALVNTMGEKNLLGHGAGHLVLQLAQKQGISVREAGLRLLRGEGWEELRLCG